MLARHDAYCSSTQVVEGKCRIARIGSKGKFLIGSVIGAEEKIRWESGQLGYNSSRSLMQTVWWNNCLDFGMRGKEEHQSKNWTLSARNCWKWKTPYIACRGLKTKTRNKVLNIKPGLIFPKMYENESRKQKGEAERRPVAFLLLFKSKRLLYLTVTDALLTDVWYKNQAIGSTK